LLSTNNKNVAMESVLFQNSYRLICSSLAL
jgi:hypothetical protein